MPLGNQSGTSPSCRRQPPRHVTDGGNHALPKEAQGNPTRALQRNAPCRHATRRPISTAHRSLARQAPLDAGDDDDAIPPIDQPLPLTGDFPPLTDDMMPLAEHPAPLADYSERAFCVTAHRGIPAVRRQHASPHPRMAKIRLFSCSTASSRNNCDAHVGTWDKRPVGGMPCGMWHLASSMSRIAYAWLRAASRQPERHVK